MASNRRRWNAFSSAGLMTTSRQQERPRPALQEHLSGPRYFGLRPVPAGGEGSRAG